MGDNDINLGWYVKEYPNCSPLFINDKDVCYLAFMHAVEFHAFFQDGAQGFFSKPIPQKIKTVEGLFKYMKKHLDCTFREDIEFSFGKPPFKDNTPTKVL